MPADQENPGTVTALRRPGHRERDGCTMRYVVSYHAAAGTGDKLREHFPAHQAWYMGFAERGLLLMIGPFTDEPWGDAMGVFTTRAAAEEFVRGDPFMRNGLIGDWSIREWNEALTS